MERLGTHGTQSKELVSVVGQFKGARPKAPRWLVTPLVVAGVGSAILSLAGIWQYGSIGAASLAAQGYAVEVVPAKISLPKARANEATRITVKVRNLTSRPVTVVGSRGTCRCTSVRALPITISQAESAQLQVSLAPRESDVGKPLTGTILLYVDAPSPPIYIKLSADTVVSSRFAKTPTEIE